MVALQVQHDGRWVTYHHDAPLRDPDRYVARLLSARGIVARVVEACDGCVRCLL